MQLASSIHIHASAVQLNSVSLDISDSYLAGKILIKPDLETTYKAWLPVEICYPG